jgi:hypothetical protein
MGSPTVDPVLPSVGQNAALAGTDGTPSDSNRYVTNSDARLARYRKIANFEVNQDVNTSATSYEKLLDKGFFLTSVPCRLKITFTCSYYNDDSDVETNFRLSVDGTPIRATAEYARDAYTAKSVALTCVVDMASSADPTQVLIEWKVSRGGAVIAVDHNPDVCHATLVIEEVEP